MDTRSDYKDKKYSPVAIWLALTFIVGALLCLSSFIIKFGVPSLVLIGAILSTLGIKLYMLLFSAVLNRYNTEILFLGFLIAIKLLTIIYIVSVLSDGAQGTMPIASFVTGLFSFLPSSILLAFFTTDQSEHF